MDHVIRDGSQNSTPRTCGGRSRSIASSRVPSELTACYVNQVIKDGSRSSTPRSCGGKNFSTPERVYTPQFQILMDHLAEEKSQSSTPQICDTGRRTPATSCAYSSEVGHLIDNALSEYAQDTLHGTEDVRMIPSTKRQDSINSYPHTLRPESHIERGSFANVTPTLSGSQAQVATTGDAGSQVDESNTGRHCMMLMSSSSTQKGMGDVGGKKIVPTDQGEEIALCGTQLINHLFDETSDFSVACTVNSHSAQASGVDPRPSCELTCGSLLRQDHEQHLGRVSREVLPHVQHLINRLFDEVGRPSTAVSVVSTSSTPVSTELIPGCASSLKPLIDHMCSESVNSISAIEVDSGSSLAAINGPLQESRFGTSPHMDDISVICASRSSQSSCAHDFVGKLVSHSGSGSEASSLRDFRMSTARYSREDVQDEDDKIAHQSQQLRVISREPSQTSGMQDPVSQLVPHTRESSSAGSAMDISGRSSTGSISPISSRMHVMFSQLVAQAGQISSAASSLEDSGRSGATMPPGDDVSVVCGSHDSQSSCTHNFVGRLVSDAGSSSEVISEISSRDFSQAFSMHERISQVVAETGQFRGVASSVDDNGRAEAMMPPCDDLSDVCASRCSRSSCARNFVGKLVSDTGSSSEAMSQFSSIHPNKTCEMQDIISQLVAEAGHASSAASVLDMSCRSQATLPSWDDLSSVCASSGSQSSCARNFVCDLVNDAGLRAEANPQVSSSGSRHSLDMQDVISQLVAEVGQASSAASDVDVSGRSEEDNLSSLCSSDGSRAVYAHNLVGKLISDAGSCSEAASLVASNASSQTSSIRQIITQLLAETTRAISTASYIDTTVRSEGMSEFGTLGLSNMCGSVIQTSNQCDEGGIVDTSIPEPGHGEVHAHVFENHADTASSICTPDGARNETLTFNSGCSDIDVPSNITQVELAQELEDGRSSACTENSEFVRELVDQAASVYECSSAGTASILDETISIVTDDDESSAHTVCDTQETPSASRAYTPLFREVVDAAIKDDTGSTTCTLDVRSMSAGSRACSSALSALIRHEVEDGCCSEFDVTQRSNASEAASDAAQPLTKSIMDDAVFQATDPSAILERVLKGIHRIQMEIKHAICQEKSSKMLEPVPEMAEAPLQKASCLLSPIMGGCGPYDMSLMTLSVSIMGRFDTDHDGHLSFDEARSLFRACAGLASKDRRMPAMLDRASFSSLCNDPTKGMSASDLCELLDLGGGTLFGPAAADESAADTHGPMPPKGKPSRYRLRRRPKHATLQLGTPKLSTVSDILALGKVVRAIRRWDSDALVPLLESGVLWANPNPRVLDLALQQALGTKAARFPLLWLAAFCGSCKVWRLIVSEISKRSCLAESAREDIEGWLLPSVICIPDSVCVQGAGRLPGAGPKDSHALLREYFAVGASVGIPEQPTLRCSLLLETQVSPLRLLLQHENWSVLVRELVSLGGGFPHQEPVDCMASVGTQLVVCGCFQGFLKACTDGGDGIRPGTSACAGLFLGLLDPKVEHLSALLGLQSLVENGLDPNKPLTHGGLWPLHAAARHDSAHVVSGLLALGANLHSKNSRGMTAMTVAREAHSLNAVNALRSAAQRRPRWSNVVQSTAS